MSAICLTNATRGFPAPSLCARLYLAVPPCEDTTADGVHSTLSTSNDFDEDVKDVFVDEARLSGIVSALPIRSIVGTGS